MGSSSWSGSRETRSNCSVISIQTCLFDIMSDNPVWQAVKPFTTGALSGMFATCCIQPIDMVKVRIQLLAGTAEAAGPLTIVRNEGLMAFYKGLDAGLTRQVVYTGARLGLFD